MKKDNPFLRIRKFFAYKKNLASVLTKYVHVSLIVGAKRISLDSGMFVPLAV